MFLRVNVQAERPPSLRVERQEEEEETGFRAQKAQRISPTRILSEKVIPLNQIRSSGTSTLVNGPG
jgi:hypothetical protein